jgi:hypothetical protein
LLPPKNSAAASIKQLGNAGLAADPINKRLILNTWPMMVATYGTTSRLHREMRFGVAV